MHRSGSGELDHIKFLDYCWINIHEEHIKCPALSTSIFSLPHMQYLMKVSIILSVPHLAQFPMNFQTQKTQNFPSEFRYLVDSFEIFWRLKWEFSGPEQAGPPFICLRPSFKALLDIINTLLSGV